MAKGSAEFCADSAILRLCILVAQAYYNMPFALREARWMNEVEAWLRKYYALDPSEPESECIEHYIEIPKSV